MFPGVRMRPENISVLRGRSGRGNTDWKRPQNYLRGRPGGHRPYHFSPSGSHSHFADQTRYPSSSTLKGLPSGGLQVWGHVPITPFLCPLPFTHSMAIGNSRGFRAMVIGVYESELSLEMGLLR